MRLFLLLLTILMPSAVWGEPQPFIVHKVLSGESIGTIAALYGASPGDVASANGYPDGESPLAAGTIILVPRSPEQTLATLYEGKRRGLGGWPKPRYADSFLEPLTPGSPEEPPLTPSPPPAREDGSKGTYTVLTGDTLYRIAKNAQVPLGDLLRANGLTEASVIHGGDVLTIPGGERSGAAQGPKEAEGKGTSTAAPPFKPQWPLRSGSGPEKRTPRGPGLFQKASPGTAVYAPASGTVLHGGWMKEYDNAVFIRHGSDFATFCGGLGILYVKAGQEVTADTKIGLISDRADPGLWFQVLRGGKSVDPDAWLEGRADP